MAIEQYFQRDVKWSGLRMSRLPGGNDRTYGCRARSLALVVPALGVPRVNPKLDQDLISSGSRMDRNRIRAAALVRTDEMLYEQGRDSQGDISIGSVYVRRVTLT